MYCLPRGIELYHRSIPFSEINKEINLIKTVRPLGFPFPNTYEIVRSSNDNYGIIMDKLNGITIDRAIRTNSDKQNNFIEKFTQAVKNLPRTHVQNEKIPDIKQVSISYAKQLNSSFCSNEDKIKIIKILKIFRILKISYMAIVIQVMRLFPVIKYNLLI